MRVCRSISKQFCRFVPTCRGDFDKNHHDTSEPATTTRVNKSAFWNLIMCFCVCVCVCVRKAVLLNVCKLLDANTHSPWVLSGRSGSWKYDSNHLLRGPVWERVQIVYTRLPCSMGFHRRLGSSSKLAALERLDQVTLCNHMFQPSHHCDRKTVCI